MFLIAGLGNPEQRYSATRHNTGFLCVDRIAEKYNIDIRKNELKALTGQGFIGSQKVMLCKPQTYMNLSGESIAALVSYYRIDPAAELLVIADDIHLPIGAIRIRKSGSNGGHNGLGNIIQLLGTDVFPRMRLGVGEAFSQAGLISHVLGNFTRDEWEILNGTLDIAASAVECFVTAGADLAMSRFNRRAAQPEEKDESDRSGTA